MAVVLNMTGMAVLMWTGMVVVVVVVVYVSCVIVVAAPHCVVVTGFVFRISSSIFGEVPSHLTLKCKINVGHEAMTVGKLHSRSSYQSLASNL